MIYIPLITECPYHETSFGFSDRNARNNHQLRCRYRCKNPLQVDGVGGLIRSQLGCGGSNNNVNMPLGETRNFSASLTNQNQNFTIGDMNVPCNIQVGYYFKKIIKQGRNKLLHLLNNSFLKNTGNFKTLILIIIINSQNILKFTFTTLRLISKAIKAVIKLHGN